MKTVSTKPGVVQNSFGNGFGMLIIPPVQGNPHTSGVNQTGGRPVFVFWLEWLPGPHLRGSTPAHNVPYEFHGVEIR